MNKKIVTILLFVLLITPLSFLVNASNLLVETTNNPNQPPNPPEIDGPRSGEIAEEHFYSFKTTDPDGNMLMTLEINWSDGDIQREGGESCTMPWESGKVINISHVWNETGDYSITARVQDVNGDWSEWSDPFEVTMPYSYSFILQIIQRIVNRFPIFQFINF